MTDTKRVLIVLKDLRVGNGVASAISSYYDDLVENNYQVDFLVLQRSNSAFVEKAEKNGTVYIMPTKKYKYAISTTLFLKQLFANHHYDVIHINIPGPFGAMILQSAKQNGIAVRIYHAHNPFNNLSLKTKVSAKIYNYLCIKRATNYLACSMTAGQSIFGTRKFDVLKNCIDSKRFEFSEEARLRIRTQLGISADTLLVGTVGRLEEQKNPMFALKCFQSMVERGMNCAYIWVGDGSKRGEIEAYIRENHLNTCVNLVGVQSNVSEWYAAMDLFLLPSRFEGLGIVFIEAQASGLVCFGSQDVPADTEVTKWMHRIPREKTSEEWADEMLTIERNCRREDGVSLVSAAGYDQKKERNRLRKIYDAICR